MDLFKREDVLIKLHEARDAISGRVEPLFFVFRDSVTPVYNGTNARSAYFNPFNVLRDYASDRGGEEYFFGLIASVHFQPDNVLEPSIEDLDIYQTFFRLYQGHSQPLHVIGSDGLNYLCITQTKKLADTSRLPDLVEKVLWLDVLTDYTDNQGFIDHCLAIEEEGQSFFDQVGNYARKNRLDMSRLLRQWRTDFTVFPQYPASVSKAVNLLGPYESQIYVSGQ
ncbi:MAG: hypothetical protein NDI94_03705 [Candidatus Woesearchaeota archaeon]|nr:hypothetical protein [Candidatus Woesearchaeota archaeon]